MAHRAKEEEMTGEMALLRGTKSTLRRLTGPLFCLVLFLTSLVFLAFEQTLGILILSLLFLTGLVWSSEKALGSRIKKKTPFPTATLAQALADMKQLIGDSTREIIIVAGSLNHQFYDSNEVMTAFESKFEDIKSGRIKLEIYTTKPEIDPETTLFCEFLEKVGVKTCFLPISMNPCIIVDDLNVRLEQPHDPENQGRRAVTVQNSIYVASNVKNELESKLEMANQKEGRREGACRQGRLLEGGSQNAC